jgi:hypothetical protein
VVVVVVTPPHIHHSSPLNPPYIPLNTLTSHIKHIKHTFSFSLFVYLCVCVCVCVCEFQVRGGRKSEGTEKDRDKAKVLSAASKSVNEREDEHAMSTLTTSISSTTSTLTSNINSTITPTTDNTRSLSEEDTKLDQEIAVRYDSLSFTHPLTLSLFQRYKRVNVFFCWGKRVASVGRLFGWRRRGRSSSIHPRFISLSRTSQQTQYFVILFDNIKQEITKYINNDSRLFTSLCACVWVGGCVIGLGLVPAGITCVLERSEQEHRAMAILFISLSAHKLLTPSHFLKG